MFNENQRNHTKSPNIHVGGYMVSLLRMVRVSVSFYSLMDITKGQTRYHAGPIAFRLSLINELL